MCFSSVHVVRVASQSATDDIFHAVLGGGNQPRRGETWCTGSLYVRHRRTALSASDSERRRRRSCCSRLSSTPWHRRRRLQPQPIIDLVVPRPNSAAALATRWRGCPTRLVPRSRRWATVVRRSGATVWLLYLNIVDVQSFPAVRFSAAACRHVVLRAPVVSWHGDCSAVRELVISSAVFVLPRRRHSATTASPVRHLPATIQHRLGRSQTCSPVSINKRMTGIVSYLSNPVTEDNSLWANFVVKSVPLTV